MKERKSTEDYLKAIYGIEAQDGVHGSDIAKAMQVSRPTVSVALRALAQEGYVRIDEGRRVYLTEPGLEIARDTCERNRFFRELLMDLGVDQETAVRDACELEHAVSPRSFSAMKAALGKRDESN